MIFSKWLALQIEQMRIDKTQTANLFQVSRATLYRWLNNQSFPSMDNLKVISKAISIKRGIPLDMVLMAMSSSIKLELLNEQ